MMAANFAAKSSSAANAARSPAEPIGVVNLIMEDDGFPNLLLNAIKAYLDTRVRTTFGKHLLKEFEDHLRNDNLLSNLMLWLGAGMDAGDGQLRAREP